MAFDYKPPRKPRRPLNVPGELFAHTDVWSVQMFKRGRWLIMGKRARWSEIRDLASGMEIGGRVYAIAGVLSTSAVLYLVAPDGRPYDCREICVPLGADEDNPQV